MNFPFKLSRLILALPILLISTTVLAHQNHINYSNYKDVTAQHSQPLVLKDGFYLGAQGGYDAYRIKRTTTAGGGLVASTSSQNSATGLAGGLYAGYGKYLQRIIYLGAEVYGNAVNAQSSGNGNVALGGLSSSYNTSFKVNNNYGISILPGLKVNDAALLYLRLGYGWSHLKGSATAEALGASFSNSRSSTQGGFEYGLGIETAICEKMSIRAQYTHANYGSFNGLATQYSTSSNQFMFGLGYHFA